MSVPVFISHVIGRCPVCGAPLTDSGFDDDPGKWEHDWATEKKP